MSQALSQVGIISCSGEELAEGTIARQAVRRVLEALRPQQTVTLCLPLFLAGEEGERRFAREHPTITLDGCSKQCAKRGTETHSGRVSASLVVADILGNRAKRCHRSTRETDQADEEAVWLVAERVAAEVDALTGPTSQRQPSEISAANAACCACGGPSPEGTLDVCGKPIEIAGLPLIFQHLWKKGLEPDEHCGQMLLKTVRIYHSIDDGQEVDYRTALVPAYRDFCRGQSRHSQ
jgi:uncharacterized metal-binding protein